MNQEYRDTSNYLSKYDKVLLVQYKMIDWSLMAGSIDRSYHWSWTQLTPWLRVRGITSSTQLLPRDKRCYFHVAESRYYYLAGWEAWWLDSNSILPRCGGKHRSSGNIIWRESMVRADTCTFFEHNPWCTMHHIMALPEPTLLSTLLSL